MSGYVEFRGLDEFLQALNHVDKNSRKRMRKHLNKQGEEFIEKAKVNTPKGRTGKLQDSYVNMQIKEEGLDMEKPIRNKAPHHHLVNNGHRLLSHKGHLIGYVSGRHYIEQTVAEEEETFTQETQDFLEELYKELL